MQKFYKKMKYIQMELQSTGAILERYRGGVRMHRILGEEVKDQNLARCYSSPAQPWDTKTLNFFCFSVHKVVRALQDHSVPANED